MFVHLQLKYPLFFSSFNQTSNFLERLSKSTQISSFLKIVEWEPCCSMQNGIEGRTEMTKLIVSFRYFANAPKNLHTENTLLYDT